MSTRSRVLSLVLLAAAIGGGGSTQSLATSEPLRVVSTLDGKLRWTEKRPPYNYAGDDGGRNLGYLITTWLRAGPHRFTVRVTDTAGRKATRTVISRVLPAPRPPRPLRGTWTRQVTPADLAKSDPRYGSGPPAGNWKLVFDRVGA